MVANGSWVLSNTKQVCYEGPVSLGRLIGARLARKKPATLVDTSLPPAHVVHTGLTVRQGNVFSGCDDRFPGSLTAKASKQSNKSPENIE